MTLQNRTLSPPLSPDPLAADPQTNQSLTAEPPALPPSTPPRHRASDLTAGGALATIDLGGQVYTLRITRAGKLILTK